MVRTGSKARRLSSTLSECKAALALANTPTQTSRVSKTSMGPTVLLGVKARDLCVFYLCLLPGLGSIWASVAKSIRPIELDFRALF